MAVGLGAAAVSGVHSVEVGRGLILPLVLVGLAGLGDGVPMAAVSRAAYDLGSGISRMADR